MKKIGIVTLCGNNNYGNKLQNYALQYVLENKGYTVESIWNSDVDIKGIKGYTKKIYHLLKKSIKNKKNFFELELKREKKFKKFSKEFIKYSEYKLTSKKKCFEIGDKYDYFIVGSDQVWNYNDPNFSDIYFLKFSRDINKNISYAASFGLDSIPKDKEIIYKEGLKNIKNISVREKNGKDFLDKIGFNNAKYVLDPTLLIEKEKWEECFKLKDNNDEKFIFIYFLSKNEEFNNELRNYAKEKNLNVIDIFEYSKKSYISDPIDFLNYIKNAELIITDSFHSTIFSILFRKKFIVIDRKSSNKNITNSRMNNLLEILNLKNRKYENGKSIDYYRNLEYANDIDEKLEQLRNESQEFLNQSIL